MITESDALLARELLGWEPTSDDMWRMPDKRAVRQWSPRSSADDAQLLVPKLAEWLEKIGVEGFKVSMHTRDGVEYRVYVRCDVVTRTGSVNHYDFDAEHGALPEKVLQAFSRHADSRSLAKYSKPKPRAAAIVRAIRGEG